jgi:threonine/homoserine/homoserine lactone efflux protein
MSFLIFALVSTYSPGPNNILSMNYASRVGFRKSYLFNIGILVGRSFTMSLCALFTGLLFDYIPKIQFPMRIIGAIYMLYLAWKCLYNTINMNTEEFKISIMNGIFVQFVNIKAFISGVNIMSSYIVPYFQEKTHILGFALLFAFIGFSASVCWGIFGTLFKKIFTNHGKIVNIIMALLLVYCSISLFL